MLYNAVLVSILQQNESATCIQIFPLFGLNSHLGHQRALNRVPSRVSSLYRLMCVNPNYASIKAMVKVIHVTLYVFHYNKKKLDFFFLKKRMEEKEEAWMCLFVPWGSGQPSCKKSN